MISTGKRLRLVERPINTWRAKLLRFFKIKNKFTHMHVFEYTEDGDFQEVMWETDVFTIQQLKEG